MKQLLALSERDLQEAANALRSGRLASPYSAIAVQRILSRDVSEGTADALERLQNRGFTPEQIAFSLDLLCADRDSRPQLEDHLELVTTGPEVDGANTRDTSVVVRDLFANARHSVLVAGYAVYQGQKVFQALADQMVAVPALRVRLFLDIQRPHGDTSAPIELVRRFTERFKQTQWPKDRPVPQVFYDPRSLAMEQEKRSSLHAKTVIVDSYRVFVSSANFTEAAHHRNVEVGMLVDSPAVATQLTQFFETLQAAGHFQPVEGL